MTEDSLTRLDRIVNLLGSARSRRDWHDMERAYEELRDHVLPSLQALRARAEKAERERDEAIARAKTSAVLAATETGKLMKVIAGADELERETIERCAKMAEEWGIDSAGFGSVPADPFAAMRMAGESIAAAIRAMRDGTP
jgi:hypothetical protein